MVTLHVLELSSLGSGLMELHLIVELIDHLPSPCAGIYGRLNHHTEVIHRLFQRDDLSFEFVFLGWARLLEGIANVLREYGQLIDVCPFYVREAWEVLGECHVVFGSFFCAVDQFQELNREWLEALSQSLEVSFVLGKAIKLSLGFRISLTEGVFLDRVRTGLCLRWASTSGLWCGSVSTAWPNIASDLFSCLRDDRRYRVHRDWGVSLHFVRKLKVDQRLWQLLSLFECMIRFGQEALQIITVTHKSVLSDLF